MAIRKLDPGIGHLLVLLERAGISNVRIVGRDAVDVIAAMLGPASFDAVNLFFPDPWPKKRHHKRRLVQPEFVAALAGILKTRGLIHIATDWSNYAEHAVEVIGRSNLFVGEAPEILANDPLAFRPPTKFERRGRRLGHEVVADDDVRRARIMHVHDEDHRRRLRKVVDQLIADAKFHGDRRQRCLRVLDSMLGYTPL